MAFIAMLVTAFSSASVVFAAVASLLKISHDIYIGAKLGTRVSSFLYLLAPFKDLIIGLIWFVPIFSTSINWRGNRYIICKGSALSPMPEGGFWLSAYNKLFGEDYPVILPDVEHVEE